MRAWGWRGVPLLLALAGLAGCSHRSPGSPGGGDGGLCSNGIPPDGGCCQDGDCVSQSESCDLTTHACVEGPCPTGFHHCPGRTGCSPEDALGCGPTCQMCAHDAFTVPACVNHACVYQCASGTHPCADGCHPDDATHCGAGCAVCPAPANAFALCVDGGCGFGCVLDACPNGSGCTLCALPPNSTAVCLDDAGQCTYQCTPGTCGPQCTVCQAQGSGFPYCADPDAGVCGTHCYAGACGPACVFCGTAPPHASYGCGGADASVCTVVCDPGWAQCVPGACQPADGAHCGQACVACPGGVGDSGVPACDGGGCTLACDPGSHPCPAGGGLTCVPENLGNCGPACAACPAPPPGGSMSCTGGACVLTCQMGWLECNGQCCAAVDLAGQTWGPAVLLDGGTAKWIDPVLGYVDVSVPGAVRLSAGLAHVCALLADAGVACWGDNTHFQLGTSPGSLPFSVSPVAVAAPPAIALAAGLGHTCLASAAGEVWCWGSGELGQLGAGSSDGPPVRVPGLRGPVAGVGAGRNASCALLAVGDAQCWGEEGSAFVPSDGGSGALLWNDAGSVGLDAGLTWLALGGGDAGAAFACAVTAGGELACWGDNRDAELGDGTLASRSAPADVSGFSTGAALAAVGDQHACALDRAGAVYCWGDGLSGQVGTGLLSVFDLPQPVTGLGSASGVIKIVAGNQYSCALFWSGSVQCWGSAMGVSSNQPSLFTGR